MQSWSKYVLCAAACAVAGSFGSKSAKAAIITAFSMENATAIATAAGTVNGPAADTGTGSSFGYHVGSSTYSTTVAGNGSAKSFSSNTWASGDYYEFDASLGSPTPGLELEFDMTPSGTGPKTFKVQYSLTGAANSYVDLPSGAFTLDSTKTFSSGSTLTTSPPRFLFDFTGMPDIEGSSTLDVRLVNTATGVAAGGTARVDNVTFGTNLPAPTPVPEPIGLAGIMLGSAGILARRPKRS